MAAQPDNAARPVLCGGCPVLGIPTAITAVFPAVMARRTLPSTKTAKPYGRTCWLTSGQIRRPNSGAAEALRIRRDLLQRAILSLRDRERHILTERRLKTHPRRS